MDIDGPLADYMQAVEGSLDLVSGTHSVSNGETLTLGARLKRFEEMSFEGVAYDELEKDRLYGTKLKLTGVYTYPDGSRETREQELYLYRWLEVVASQDASVATGRTAAFHKQLNKELGLGKILSDSVSEKEIQLHLPESVATTFEGSKPDFKYSGEFTNVQTAQWLYEGNLPNQWISGDIKDTVKVKVDGHEVGEFTSFLALPKQALLWLEDGILNQPFNKDNTSDLSQEEKFIYIYREQILGAASSQRERISASLIAAIIHDELSRRDRNDNIQDSFANDIIRSEGNREIDLIDQLQGLHDKPIGAISFGPAQVQQQLFVQLVNEGYLRQPDNWQTDRLDESLRLIMSPRYAPYIVAAYLQYIIDLWRRPGGADLSQRPDILASLYHQSPEGPRGVNPNPGPNNRGRAIHLNRPRMNEILQRF